MSRIERIFKVLHKHNGKQVGGSESHRIEIDFGIILELFNLEDEISRLHEFEMENIILKNYIKEMQKIGGDK